MAHIAAVLASFANHEFSFLISKQSQIKIKDRYQDTWSTQEQERDILDLETQEHSHKKKYKMTYHTSNDPSTPHRPPYRYHHPHDRTSSPSYYPRLESQSRCSGRRRVRLRISLRLCWKAGRRLQGGWVARLGSSRREGGGWRGRWRGCYLLGLPLRRSILSVTMHDKLGFGAIGKRAGWKGRDEHHGSTSSWTTSKESSWLSFVVHALDGELIRAVHVLCYSCEERRSS